MKRSYLVTGRFAVIDAYDNMLTDQEFLKKIFIVSHLRAAQKKALLYMEKRIAKKHGRGAYFEQLSDLRVRRHERKMKVKKKRQTTNQQRLF